MSVSATPVAARSTPKEAEVEAAAAAIDDGDHTDKRIARIQGRRSAAVRLPHPPERYRLVSSILRALTRVRLIVVDDYLSFPFFSFLFFLLSPFSLSFLLCLSRSGPERNRARATLYHRRPNNANRGAYALATPGRERESHDITTSRTHLSVRLTSARARETEREREIAEGRRWKEDGKASRHPLSHAHAFRQLDTSDTSVLSSSCSSSSVSLVLLSSSLS